MLTSSLDYSLDRFDINSSTSGTPPRIDHEFWQHKPEPLSTKDWRPKDLFVRLDNLAKIQLFETACDEKGAQIQIPEKCHALEALPVPGTPFEPLTEASSELRLGEMCYGLVEQVDPLLPA